MSPKGGHPRTQRQRGWKGRVETRLHPWGRRMSVLGITLVLAAACCHATWNVFIKRVGGGAELIWLFSVVSVVVYLPLAAWILVVDRPSFGAIEIGFIAGSTLFHLSYFLLLQAGYRVGDLSVVYPTARATGPIISTTFAVAFLGESVTPQMAFGAGTIVFGVFMLTGGIRSRTAAVPASLAFGLGAGALIGSYTAWDAYAVSALLVPPLMLDYASSLGRVVLLTPIAWRKADLIRAHWRRHKAEVIAIAVFNPLAYILVLYALVFTPVVYVAPTREVSVLLTVIAGSALLGEGGLRPRLSWAAVILAGMTILISG